MSGGFFRGTSADQDTRFSNKQSKLLKSQKFPPELDHLVDTTKVKMDVIRPWIATRATELLGFEDEVLINFVYGLLEGKAVDGKKIQIQLTGFMEKNTSKFMKELWSLLLTAQVNVSGVPQQFLDAKEEEMKTKKAETDRIVALETQKRQEREERESERRKQARMDGDVNITTSTNAVPNSVSDRSGDSKVYSEEEREEDVRNGRRSKKRDDPKSRSVSVSPHSQRHSISPERRYRSPRRRSISATRPYRSPHRLSISPRRRFSPRGARSPPRKTSPRLSISPRLRYSPRRAWSPRKTRRRSGSRPRHISPSPSRRRSPRGRRRSPLPRHRSPSPARRRSPSPLRRRSPVRRRSPSPYRRRSPIRRRSPSPSRHRSPIRRRPLSPARRRSPSPVRRRSPPMVLKHRDSPLRSPRNYAADLQISPRRRKRNRSPYRSPSLSYRARRSISTERDSRGVNSKQHQDNYSSQRTREKRSPGHHALVREVAEHTDIGHKVSDSVSDRQPISVRSPQRDSRDQADIRDRVSIVVPVELPNRSESPTYVQKINSRRNKSLSRSPVKQTREPIPHYDSSDASREEGQTKLVRETHHRTHSSNNRSKDLLEDKGIKNIHTSGSTPEIYSTDGSAENQSPSSRDHAAKLGLRKRDHEERRDRELTETHVQRVSPSSGAEYVAGKVKEERSSSDDVHKQQPTKQQARVTSPSEGKINIEQALKHSHVDGRRAHDERRTHSKSEEYIEPHFEIESVSRSKTKVDKSKILNAIGSDTDETETHTEKHRHKKTDRHKKHINDDSRSESEVDDRKLVKRRRKEEKMLRKEERRRKREERHRRKLERRASKLKTKSMDTVDPPSDMENSLSGSDRSDGQAATRKVSRSSDTEEPESQQKKLEIELRKKALESLRAKKAISD